MLNRAIGSVMAQERPADAVSVAIDHKRAGSAWTRQRALQAVQTEWVAFLDDDDHFRPNHLAVLLDAADETGADYLFTWFQMHDSAGNERDWDPLGHFGKTFDPENPTQTTITTLVRTELAQTVGFCEPPVGKEIHGQRLGEDFEFTLGCIAAGGKVVHVPQRTWIWTHHGANTSGQPDRW